MSLVTKLQEAITRIGQEIKTVRSEFLSKTNTTSYAPTTDFHPATKKYVDDNDEHDHDTVYEPIFTKNTAFNKNFGSATATVCQGNDFRLSNQRIPTDGSVSYAKLGNDFKTYATLTQDSSGNVNVNWTTGSIFKIALTASGILTHTNLQLNKVITLQVTGNHSLNIGNNVIAHIVSGEYDGSAANFIQMHYIGNYGFLSMHEFIVTISQPQ